MQTCEDTRSHCLGAALPAQVDVGTKSQTARKIIYIRQGWKIDTLPLPVIYYKRKIAMGFRPKGLEFIAISLYLLVHFQGLEPWAR